MESTTEEDDFLNKCEQEFHHRYTDKDEDFYKVKFSTLIDPPIIDPWPCERETSRGTSRRESTNKHSHSQRRDSDRGNARYKQDRHERRKKQKRRDRDDRERNRYRSADRTRGKDERTAGRKRHNDRRSEESSRKSSGSQGNRYRDEGRDRRHRRDNKNRDGRKYKSNYWRGREPSRDRPRHVERDFGNKRYQQKVLDLEKNAYENKSLGILETCNRGNNQHSEQNIWDTYVSKHNLYENYRPYF